MAAKPKKGRFKHRSLLTRTTSSVPEAHAIYHSRCPGCGDLVPPSPGLPKKVKEFIWYDNMREELRETVEYYYHDLIEEFVTEISHLEYELQRAKDAVARANAFEFMVDDPTLGEAP